MKLSALGCELSRTCLNSTVLCGLLYHSEKKRFQEEHISLLMKLEQLFCLTLKILKGQWKGQKKLLQMLQSFGFIFCWRKRSSDRAVHQKWLQWCASLICVSVFDSACDTLGFTGLMRDGTFVYEICLANVIRLWVFWKICSKSIPGKNFLGRRWSLWFYRCVVFFLSSPSISVVLQSWCHGPLWDS